MGDGWPLVPFAECMERVERKIVLDDAAEYETVGVRWYGQGAFVRERQLGAQIARKQQWVIHEGDVVYNKLFAWKGAFAVADASVHGRIVSDKFPTYRPVPQLLDPRYVAWWFRAPTIAKQAESMSKGAAAISKLTLNPPQFWELTIPLPPIEEQRRIVARVEAIAAKVEEAQRLRRAAEEEGGFIERRVIDNLLGFGGWPLRSLRNLLREPSRNGLSAFPSPTPPGIPVLRISAVTSRGDARVDESDVRYLAIDEDEATKYFLEPGDLLACRFNGNLRFVGRFAIYVGESGTRQVYPDKLIRFRVDASLADPRFVALAMNAGKTRKQIEALCATTAGNIGISASKLQEVRLPLPPKSVQEAMVARLEGLTTALRALHSQQMKSRRELDAFVPAVLDRAFRGEL
ncbi:MAG: restriction endonuclease subunit S [Hyphomicrobiales bacterium]